MTASLRAQGSKLTVCGLVSAIVSFIVVAIKVSSERYRVSDLTGEIAIVRALDLTGEIAIVRASDLTGEIAIVRASDLTGEIAIVRASDLTGEKYLSGQPTNPRRYSPYSLLP